MKQTSDVFGMSNTILRESYVNRASLDEEIKLILSRKVHLALRGESKCGKSWLRQNNIPDAIVVQCRFRKTIIDLYIDALSQLNIEFNTRQNSESRISGELKAIGEVGLKLLAKVGIETTVSSVQSGQTETQIVGHNIQDLRYIAEIIVASGKRLVIEDFHYLSIEQRKVFSYDLKALWDYGCFIIIIGVWSQSNLLPYLNPDLSGRVTEKSIYWSKADLVRVIERGSNALNIQFSDSIRDLLINDCFGNVGLLQCLALLLLDKAQIFEEQNKPLIVENEDHYLDAATEHAEQLNATYLQFAQRVSRGIHKRTKDATGIYAHTMKVIVESSNEKLEKGLYAWEIYDVAYQRQPRIQIGNLKSILKKLEELQVDEDGRGLVISYDESNQMVSIVDRQLLFYKQYLTMQWPWDDIIAEQQTIK